MTKIEQFLQKIHLSADQIASLTGETDIDIEKLSTDYLQGRQDYFESSVMPGKIKAEIDSTVEGMTLKAIKSVNKSLQLGLTNTQMEEFKSIDDFMVKAQELNKKVIEGLTKGQNEDLVKQINELKEAVSNKQTELDTVLKTKDDDIKRISDEKAKEVQIFKAKEVFQKMVKDDKDLPDIPGKDFALENIMEKIFITYDVQEDGRILNKDGTIPMHPDTSRPIAAKTLEDIYPYYKGLAGLVKVNNAGQGGSGSPDPGLNPDGTRKAAGEAEKHFLAQLN